VSIASHLLGCYIDCARPFFALADFELDRLAFVQIRVAGCFDFGVVHKQICPSVVRNDKPKTLAAIEPFYFTCTHCNTPWPFRWPSICNVSPTFVLEDIPERRKDMLDKTPVIQRMDSATIKKNENIQRFQKIYSVL